MKDVYRSLARFFLREKASGDRLGVLASRREIVEKRCRARCISIAEVQRAAEFCMPVPCESRKGSRAHAAENARFSFVPSSSTRPLIHIGHVRGISSAPPRILRQIGRSRLWDAPLSEIDRWSRTS